MRDPRAARGATLFWPYVLHLWTIFGLAISNALLGIAILAAPFSVRRREVPWERFRGALTPLALYVLILLTSIAASYSPRVSLPSAGEIFSLATLPLGLIALRTERRIRLAMNGLVLLAALLSLWGLGQFLTGAGGMDWRIRGPFSHYMTFAGVLLMADLIVVSQLVSRRFGRWGWRWLALVLINAALVGSLTRSAWVALLASLVVLFLLRAPRLLLVLAPAAVVILLVSPETVRQRAGSIFSLENITNYDRLCMLEAGMHMVAERPLFGLGPRMVEQRYPIYRHPTAPRPRVAHLHNSYVQLAAERGLLSLAAYVWLLGATLLLGYRGLRRELDAGNGQAELWLGAFTALLAFCLAGLFEDNWRDTEVQRVALFVMALPYCLEARGNGADEAERTADESVA